MAWGGVGMEPFLFETRKLAPPPATKRQVAAATFDALQIQIQKQQMNYEPCAYEISCYSKSINEKIATIKGVLFLFVN